MSIINKHVQLLLARITQNVPKQVQLLLAPITQNEPLKTWFQNDLARSQMSLKPKLNHSLIIVKDERWWWFQRDTLGVNSTWFSTVIIGVVTRVTYYLNRLFMWTVIVCIAQIKVAPGSFITPKAIYGLNITRHAVGTCTFLRDVVLVTTTTAQILLHQECVA